MRERITITNYGLEPVPLLLELICDVDFADLFEVKESRVRTRGRHAQRLDRGALVFTHEQGKIHRTVVISSTGDPRLEPGLVAWRNSLAPSTSWEICLEVSNVVNGLPIEERFRCGDTGQEPLVHRYDTWLARLPEVESDNRDLVAAVQRAGQDLGALRIIDPETDLTVPAAGAPWFMTLFGRDSLLTAWMALPADPSLASGVLQSLARLQGRDIVPSTEEQPGRIMHETRFGAATGLLLGGGDVYYGSVDSTPLFVMVLGELRRWGLHDEMVRQLLPHADRAVEWIETFGDRDGDGYVEYQRATPAGLANQGWKDSWDAIRFADGRLAEPPIALCEVQAYTYAAYVARSHFALEAGDIEVFEKYRGKADELRRRFNEDFWLEEQGTFALGLDAHKRPIDAVASNAGHCLWAGLAEPEKAELVSRRLLAPDMFSGWGVRTLASTMAAYNPVSYHNGSVWPHDNALCAAGLARYGHIDAAHRVIEAQLAVAATAAGQLPELFAGFDRSVISVPAAYPASCSPQAWAAASPLLWLRTLLGLEPWAPGGADSARPFAARFRPSSAGRGNRDRRRSTVRSHRRRFAHYERRGSARRTPRPPRTADARSCGSDPFCPCAAYSLVELHVICDHASSREPVLHRLATRGAVDLPDPLHRATELVSLAPDEPRDAVCHELGNRTTRGGNDRRAAGERLDDDHAEWLRPRQRIEQTGGAHEQELLCTSTDLADVLDAPAEHRGHRIFEVRELRRLTHLGCDAQRQVRVAGNSRRSVDALVGSHPSEEQRVAAVAGPEGERVDIDAVMDDCGDLGVTRAHGVMLRHGDDRDPVGDGAVERAELAFKGSVIGGHDRDSQPLATGGSEQCVVVNHIGVPLDGGLVRVLDVVTLDLFRRLPDGGRARGGRMEPATLHLTGAVACGVQQHVVPNGPQPTGEGVEHCLRASVRRRRYRKPRRSDDRDAHV